MSTDFRVVALSLIQPNPVALRTVNRENEEFLNLARDVKKRGIINPIIVREKLEDATGDSYFELCDGLQRFSAAQDAGLENVPVIVRDLTDDQVEEEQIVLNLVRVQTKPVEYANQLRRMMQKSPTMTEAELADRISQSASFVRNRLGLLNLDGPIQKLIEDGSIGLANAYALSKLPREKQHDWTDAAMTKAPGEFVEEVNKFAKELKDAAREGRPVGEKTFEAKAKARKVAEIEGEIKAGSVFSTLASVAGISTLEEAFVLGLQFCVSLDPVSVAAQRDSYEADERAKKADKAKKELAKKELARRQAAEKAEAAKSESGVVLSDEELDELVAAQEAADAAAAAERARKKAEKEAAAAAAGETTEGDAPAAE